MVYTPRDSVSNFCLGEEEMTISITGSSNTCEILFWIFREEEADMTTNTEGVTPSEGVHTGGVQLSEKSWKFSDGEMILLKISERGCESTRVPEARGAGRGWRLGARSRGVPAPPAMGLPEARGRAGGGGSGPGRGDSWKSITWLCTVCVILRLITGWTSTLCHIASNINLSPPWILETISQTGCTPSAVQSAVSSSPSQDSNYNITGREHAACELLSSSPPPYTRNNISEELYPQCHIRTNSIGVFREYYE